MPGSELAARHAQNERTSWSGCGENERLRRRLTHVEADLEQAQRADKRQAAPFSKGNALSITRRPGRRAGENYGQRAHRAIPERVDREVEVGLPDSCPHCGGAVEHERTAAQYQEDLPDVRPMVARFRVHIGHCQRCGRRVQARHPEQTSDALGAAATQVGHEPWLWPCNSTRPSAPRWAKTAAIVRQVSGIALTPGGLSQALARAAQQAIPTYDALVEAGRKSPVVAPAMCHSPSGSCCWMAWRCASSVTPVSFNQAKSRPLSTISNVAWTSCWPCAYGTRQTGGLSSTSLMNVRPCSPIYDVTAWRRPTGAPSRPSGQPS